jgi:hypothetical protein
MKIVIERVDDAVAVMKDLKSIQGRGELSHVIAELEILKQELLLIWMDYDGDK